MHDIPLGVSTPKQSSSETGRPVKLLFVSSIVQYIRLRLASRAQERRREEGNDAKKEGEKTKTSIRSSSINFKFQNFKLLAQIKLNPGPPSSCGGYCGRGGGCDVAGAACLCICGMSAPPTTGLGMEIL